MAAPPPPPPLQAFANFGPNDGAYVPSAGGTWPRFTNHNGRFVYGNCAASSLLDGNWNDAIVGVTLIGGGGATHYSRLANGQPAAIPALGQPLFLPGTQVQMQGPGGFANVSLEYYLNQNDRYIKITDATSTAGQITEFIFPVTQGTNPYDVNLYGASLSTMLSKVKTATKKDFFAFKQKVAKSRIIGRLKARLDVGHQVITADFIHDELRPTARNGLPVWYETTARLPNKSSCAEVCTVRIIAYSVRGALKILASQMEGKPIHLVTMWTVHDEALMEAGWFSPGSQLEEDEVAALVALVTASVNKEGKLPDSVSLDKPVAIKKIRVEDDIIGAVSNMEGIDMSTDSKNFGLSLKHLLRKAKKSKLFKKLTQKVIHLAEPVVSHGIKVLADKAGKTAAMVATGGIEVLTKSFGGALSPPEDLVQALDADDGVEDELPGKVEDMTPALGGDIIDQKKYPICVVASTTANLKMKGFLPKVTTKHCIQDIVHNVGGQEAFEKTGIPISKIAGLFPNHDPDDTVKVGARPVLPVAEAIKVELHKGNPVTAGMEFDENITKPLDATGLPVPIDDLNEGGFFHCVTITGYDDSDMTFVVLNSFGDKWGAGGRFLVSQSYKIEEAWVYEKYDPKKHNKTEAKANFGSALSEAYKTEKTHSVVVDDLW